MFNDGSKFLGTHSDGAREELGDVVAAKELPMVLRVVLRQLEWAREMSVAIVVCDERPGEVAIVAPRREYDPCSVARP